MEFINLTGHDLNLNDGRVIKRVEDPTKPDPKDKTGTRHAPIAARVSATFGEFNEDLICSQSFGEIINLPAPKPGVKYVVSAMVLAAGKTQGRTDLVAPATGHPLCVRSDDGKDIKSVPGFVC
jgi:hypothetical protein